MRSLFAFVALLNIAICGAQVRKVCDLNSMPEISGMFIWNNHIWATNDGGNASKIYRIDTSGNILDSTTFSNASNNDWEELATNGVDIFIGDFGNNNGTRKDLRIFKFPFAKLGSQNVSVDTISFYYSSQSDFASNPFTIYDAEAMVANPDSILLFSKSKADAVCRIYSIPNKNGNHVARLLDTFQLDFWVCGATTNNLNVTLIGYGIGSSLLPRMATIQRKDGGFNHPAYTESLNLDYSNQCESAYMSDPETIHIATEASNGFPAALYSYSLPSLGVTAPLMDELLLYPNPASGHVVVINPSEKKGFLLFYCDSLQLTKTFELNGKSMDLDVSGLPRGAYQVVYHGAHTAEEVVTLVLK
jgi:hypothetical protein